MKITNKWLKENNACFEGYEWALKQEGIKSGIDVCKFLDLLVEDNHWDWVNWVIVRVMNEKQCLSYAIFSAEQVIGIYEYKYPDNKAPRKAIEAAKLVLDNKTEENKSNAASAAAYTAKTAAAAAAAAAYAASAAAYAAAAAAAAAAYAADAYVAAYAASAAAYAAAAYAAKTAAAAAAVAAYTAKTAAADAYVAAKKEMQTKILSYGINLLKGEV